jgi:hypothetical protein
MFAKVYLAIGLLALTATTKAPVALAQPPPTQTKAESQPLTQTNERIQTTLTVVLYDGDQHLFSNRNAEVTVVDEKSGESRTSLYHGGALSLTFADSGGEAQTCTISVHAPGFKSTETKHLRIENGGNTSISLMLVPRHAGLDMDQAHWQDLTREDPELMSRLLCNNQGPQDCSSTYEQILRQQPDNLAALINISVALQQIQIGGRSAFSYYQSIGLDHSLFRDRFFAYVDKALLQQLKADSQNHHRDRPAGDAPFARLHGSWILHRHATISFKELDLDSANVQITFQEKDTRVINGIECVRVDTDIDYYKRFAHGLLEVIPNLLMHKRTDPEKVYRLRWNATKKQQARGSGISDFAPPIGLKAKEENKNDQ